MAAAEAACVLEAVPAVASIESKLKNSARLELSM
jgi:hypothetical protein